MGKHGELRDAGGPGGLDHQGDVLGIAPVDYLLVFWPISLVMTMIAVGGIANAVNIIDGYNGLASGFVMIASIGLAIIGWQVNDHFISLTAVAILGASAGFWLWN